MDALRNFKKISLLAVAILFLFTLFNLILDAHNRYHQLWIMIHENGTNYSVSTYLIRTSVVQV
jgi:hypothetical protein